MPSKIRDRDHVRHRERRPREQESEGEEGLKQTRVRDKERHTRSSHGLSKRSSKVKDKDRRKEETGRSSPSSTSSHHRKKKSMSGTDPDRPVSSPSCVESRSSLPYPSFSKQHSKEAVGSRESLGLRLNVLTPDPTATDISGEKGKDGRRPSAGNGVSDGKRQTKRQSQTTTRPPSPPLTNDDPDFATGESTVCDRRNSEEKDKDVPAKVHDETKKPKTRPHSSRSTSSVKRKSSEQGLKSNGRTSKTSTPSKLKFFEVLQFPHKGSQNASSSSSKTKTSEKNESSRRSKKSLSPPHSTISDNETVTDTVDSDATSVAPIQVKTTSNIARDARNRPSSRSDTPSQRIPIRARGIDVEALRSPTTPPPPPPPPQIPLSRPRVDYLLQNGGLGYHVPRNFLGAGESANMPQYMFQPNAAGIKLFEPYSRLLDDYSRVFEKDGSLAVATGYRSVARRLLDRLEAVFARDISSEICECVMCFSKELPGEAGGVSWGEVLEIVSGRRQLPPWPPFHIAAEPDPADIGKQTKAHIPMQKLDADVPEEFREHYVRQSRKTKLAVDTWLSRQPEQTIDPPDEVDDETLAFAMLTYLDQEQRDVFYKLLDIPMARPAPKRETPKPRERPVAVVIAGAAIQRLYRLPEPPRDPEAALFLVKNFEMHDVLATVSEISDDEWDILTSGRFDGFLRSGAEEDLPTTSATAPPWNAGRMTNPQNNGGKLRPNSQPYGAGGHNGRNGANSTKGPITGTSGAPISIDEETEIAALAEIERDIYMGMEALEDAFEVLHGKAEAVRSALRERGAGLTAANQARRGNGSGGNIQVLAGTPVNRGYTPFGETGSVTDDGIDDGISEIAPSDSASNISSNRRRRPKRRNERRTPAAVEEEDEGY